MQLLPGTYFVESPDLKSDVPVLLLPQQLTIRIFQFVINTKDGVVIDITLLVSRIENIKNAVNPGCIQHEWSVAFLIHNVL